MFYLLVKASVAEWQAFLTEYHGCYFNPIYYSYMVRFSNTYPWCVVSTGNLT